MKAPCTAALLVLASLLTMGPAAAQEARPLPPDSFLFDGPGLRSFSAPTPPTTIIPPQTGLMTLPASPLPPGSFRFDSRQQELRPFGAPRPEPKPEPRPEKATA